MENKGKAFVSLAFALVALLVLAPIVGAQGEPQVPQDRRASTRLSTIRV
jgi:hypothetical protein